MLEISRLTKSYAKSPIKAVDDLTLTVNDGEIYGFIGPNGAGKTTTIKMICGILDIADGYIKVDGSDIQKNPLEAKQKLGYVSDSHIIYDKLTGREYVNFLADVYGVSAKDRQLRSERMLEIFELTSAFDNPIKTYSHGMKQKISIIGALIHNPRLWILDEPMTGLDPQSAFQLKSLMREHCASGNSVFFSTHVLEVAEKLCDRVGIIVKGKLVKEGTMAEIVDSTGEKSLEEVFLELISSGKNGESEVKEGAK